MKVFQALAGINNNNCINNTYIHTCSWKVADLYYIIIKFVCCSRVRHLDILKMSEHLFFLLTLTSLKRPSDVYSIVKKLSANALWSYIQYSITQLSILSILRIFNKLSWNNLNQPYSFNPIQDGLFLSCSNLLHISYNDETWHNYTLLKEDPKNLFFTRHTLWVLLTSAFFSWKSTIFDISGNTDKDKNFKTFFGSLKVVLINMVGILMSSKSVT